MRSQGSSSIAGWALVLARTLDARAIDSRAVFAEAGVDRDHVKHAGARVPTASMARLWDRAAVHARDPSLGLHTAEHLHPTMYHALSFLFFASGSLLQALNQLIRYQRVIVTAARISMRRTAEAYEFSWRNHPAISPYAVDGFGASVVQLCRMLSASPLAPLHVELSRHTPRYPQEYEQFYGCSVAYHAATSVIHFPRGALEETITSGNRELFETNERLVQQYLDRLASSEIINLVHATILDGLGGGDIGEAAVAGTLNMSLRSFQRTLQRQGTSFREILEAAREQTARDLVTRTELAIGDISYRLGYRNPTNFSAAFRRWTGASPSAYRRAALQHPAP